jgi:hypothetical protein
LLSFDDRLKVREGSKDWWNRRTSRLRTTLRRAKKACVPVIGMARAPLARRKHHRALDNLSKKLAATALCGVAWTLSVALNLRTLFAYENTPGAVGAISQTWPSSSQISRATGHQTLVVLAHPRCPCTRASVAELAHIMAQSAGRVDACVLFWKPNGSGSEWDDSRLRNSAGAIPGVKILTDVDGIEAARFGAATSGQTLLFDRDGRLLFSGGITASRGHEGENAGERALISLIRDDCARGDISIRLLVS